MPENKTYKSIEEFEQENLPDIANAREIEKLSYEEFVDWCMKTSDDEVKRIIRALTVIADDYLKKYSHIEQMIRL
jgi:hypothetical protein